MCARPARFCVENCAISKKARVRPVEFSQFASLIGYVSNVRCPNNSAAGFSEVGGVRPWLRRPLEAAKLQF